MEEKVAGNGPFLKLGKHEHLRQARYSLSLNIFSWAQSNFFTLGDKIDFTRPKVSNNQIAK